MFVLYYYQQDYGGDDFDILAVSHSREKLEKKLTEIAEPQKKFKAASEEYKRNCKEKIRAFCERQIDALKISPNVCRSAKKTGKTAEELEILIRNEQIECVMRDYHFFKKEWSSPPRYFDQDKLTEAFPILDDPPPYPGTKAQEFLFIKEIEEI